MKLKRKKHFFKAPSCENSPNWISIPVIYPVTITLCDWMLLSVSSLSFCTTGFKGKHKGWMYWFNLIFCLSRVIETSWYASLFKTLYALWRNISFISWIGLILLLLLYLSISFKGEPCFNGSTDPRTTNNFEFLMLSL